MKKKAYEVIYQSQQYLSSLGNVKYRALFGGYSLAVGDTVFAMVADGGLYLRACEESADYFREKNLPSLIVAKNGRNICLNYYQVDEQLWLNPEKLLELSGFSLDKARREKQEKELHQRIKDLPNLSLQLEILLWRAGITDVPTLRACGSKDSWLRLRQLNKKLGLNVLLALEGAICGLHIAALPAQTRRELQEWFNEHNGNENYTIR